MKVAKDEKNVRQKNTTKINKPEKDDVNIEPPDIDEEGYAIIPPNGGWGWLVVLSAFYCNVVVDGIQLTFGIFLDPISKSLNSAYSSVTSGPFVPKAESNSSPGQNTVKTKNVLHSEVSLAGSLMFGLHLLMGPFCAGCNNAFGLRPVIIVGSLICCFGIGISYFSKDYYFLCFSYGVIGGIGLSLVYMNTIVITSLYFTTLLPIAVGIVVCGTGVGTMVFAVLGSFLIKRTTWQNSFLIQAALAGSMSIAAIVFRPLKPIPVTLTPPQSTGIIAGPSTIRKSSVFVKTDISKKGSLASIGTMQSVAWGFAKNVAIKDLEEGYKKRCACSKCCGRKKKATTDETLLHLAQLKKSNMELYTEKSIKQKLESKKDPSSTISLKPLYKRIEINKKKAKHKICAPVKQTLGTMLDCSLLKSCSFFLFTISGAMHVAAMIIVFIYEKDRARDLGFTENMSVIFLITLGATNVFWRLVLGILAAFVKVNYKLLLIVGNIIGGVATLTSGFISNIYYEFVFCFFFSLSMATGAVFRVVLLVDLVGIEKIAVATGINLLFMGVFCIISPPILGRVMEATKSYQVIFSTTGGIIILSGLLLFGVRKVAIKQKQKEKKKGKTKS